MENAIGRHCKTQSGVTVASLVDTWPKASIPSIIHPSIHPSSINRPTHRPSSNTAALFLTILCKPKPTRSGVAPADLLGRPTAPATRAAIARVSRIHGRYRPQGTMSDEDLLYVLSLFAVEPTRWVERFEWRAMDARERGALAVLWRWVGGELGIPVESV
ncbi:hypothetical protein E0Z10_g6492 [Xylaria hypoxylon]|uniref:ER-bound oxygenase mpaB/mpaB'/Rubber oxygenase catalytic domain-containing protein n=1 Tax=Xylaria hypoxylon TaxID=37992 RepID=A0A4Z0YG06_9PEZI|nr:hypothetical protein E0Z10_g6492 [Xylaria hypoxylon]